MIDHKLSFILTMWYVNYSKNKLDKEKRKCFILTMWYVNKIKQ